MTDATHAIVHGPGEARVLIMLPPGKGVGFFRDVAAEGLSPGSDMSRINEIAATYGVEFVGPPIEWRPRADDRASVL
ncbi:hypothetical protein [Jannaschia aquimarina]|uniref:Uncharacterized protein n=1 Tax=Jannaschia aquimarina TaxID=935700 RepID=A0A0D1EIB3_9RHOB|nr:hypothetical protein [Jannaschia aquimarina]KIT17329.1 hypothetical protein jaqu_10610 [Jannaschia aquimarina]SNT20405.1 hypothetical protein SAMN05421775_107187 [Jannaschia aquimarina]